MSNKAMNFGELTLGRVVHAYVHRGSSKHGPIAAMCVQVDPCELKLFPGSEHAWLVTDVVAPVSAMPGFDRDQTIPQTYTWEWPPRK